MASEEASVSTKVAKSSPIPMALTDDTKDLFLPYLALKYTVQNTLFKSSTNTAYEALRCSIIAALQGLSIPFNEDKARCLDEEWERIMTTEDYRDIIKKLAILPRPDDDGGDMSDDQAEQLKAWCDDSRLLSEEQLHYILMLINGYLNTNFRLGIITEGFVGAYNPATQKHDDKYVQPTRIRVVEPDTSNGPVLWLYNDNADEREVAHGHRALDSKAKPLHRWKALTIEEERESTSRLKVVQNWQVGEAVDTDIERGVWILRRDQHDPQDANKIEAHAGCFMRLADDQSEAVGGFLILKRRNGSPIVVSEEDVGKIELDEESKMRLNNTTDLIASRREVELPGTRSKAQESKSTKPKGSPKKQTATKTPKSNSAQNNSENGTDAEGDGRDGEAKEAEKSGKKKPKLTIDRPIQKLSFFRVLPPSKMCREISERMDGSEDPVYGFIVENEKTGEHLEVNTGDIVLDREGESEIAYGRKTRLVRDVYGEEGQVWERRLQRISDPPFALRDDLHALTSWKGGFSKATLPELKAMLRGLGLSTEGVKPELTKRIRDELEQDKTSDTKRYLTVYRALSDINASEIDRPVDIEEGEVLIEDQDAPAGEEDCVLRDFEGIEAQVERKDVELVTARGWNLRLRDPGQIETYYGDSNTLFQPQEGTPLPADESITYGNGSRTERVRKNNKNARAQAGKENDKGLSFNPKKRGHSALKDADNSSPAAKIARTGESRSARTAVVQNAMEAEIQEDEDEEMEEAGFVEEEVQHTVEEEESSGDDEDEDKDD